MFENSSIKHYKSISSTGQFDLRMVLKMCVLPLPPGKSYLETLWATAIRSIFRKTIKDLFNRNVPFLKSSLLTLLALQF